MGWVYGIGAVTVVLLLVELGFRLFADPEHKRQMAELERAAKKQLRQERLQGLQRDRLPPVSRDPLDYRRAR